MNVAKHMGMLDGTPVQMPTTHHLVGDGEPGSSYIASVAGYFAPSVALLDKVVVGQGLGVIQDFAGEVLQELVSGRDGFVSTLRAVPRVNEGDALISVLGGEAL